MNRSGKIYRGEGGRNFENKRRERTERQIQVVRCSDSFHAQTNTRVLPLWNFPKDTERPYIVSRIRAEWRVIRFYSFDYFSLSFFSFPSKLYFYNLKKMSRGKSLVSLPRLKVENDGVDGAARGIPRFRGVTRCILAVARRRNRGGAQQRRPRWNVLTHNEIVLFHGFQGAVGLFRFSPCSKHVPYPRISVYPVFENSPSTCHHPTNFIHFSKTEKFLLFLSSFFPPPRFVKIRLAINDVIRIIVKFLPIFLSNKWILNNRGREKKRRKSERVSNVASKRDVQVW